MDLADVMDLVITVQEAWFANLHKVFAQREPRVTVDATGSASTAPMDWFVSHLRVFVLKVGLVCLNWDFPGDFFLTFVF